MTRAPLGSRSGEASNRYELLVKIAVGGTSTVYLGRAKSTEGFTRLVAIKRMHPHLLEDPGGRKTIVREAALASRIHHAHVVAVQDVETTDDELLLVMDYVEGGSLAELLEAQAARGGALPPAVATRIVLDACEGLAAVHSLTDDHGRKVPLLHRDMSPQNVLVGLDGVSRITDFGLARIEGNTSVSRTTGTVTGKLAYLAPELLEGAPHSVATEVFSIGVVAWEALSNERLFRAATEAETVHRLVRGKIPLLSQAAPAVGRAFDAALARCLDRDPAKRFSSIRELYAELEKAAKRAQGIATGLAVADCVGELLGAVVAERRRTLAPFDAAANEGDLSFGETASMLHSLPQRLAEVTKLHGAGRGAAPRPAAGETTAVDGRLQTRDSALEAPPMVARRSDPGLGPPAIRTPIPPAPPIPAPGREAAGSRGPVHVPGTPDPGEEATAVLTSPPRPAFPPSSASPSAPPVDPRPPPPAFEARPAFGSAPAIDSRPPLAATDSRAAQTVLVRASAPITLRRAAAFAAIAATLTGGAVLLVLRASDSDPADASAASASASATARAPGDASATGTASAGSTSPRSAAPTSDSIPPAATTIDLGELPSDGTARPKPTGRPLEAGPRGAPPKAPPANPYRK